MLISSTLRPSYQPSIAAKPSATSAESSTFHNEPIDGWNPGESKAMAELAPYSLAALAVGGGVVAAAADGVAGALGGAFALGAAGAGGALFFSGLSELGGEKVNYQRSALIGGALGAGLGAAAGAFGGPIAGIATAVVGAGGGYILGSFLQH